MKRAALCASALLAIAFVAGCGGGRTSAPHVTTNGLGLRGPLHGSLVVEIRLEGGPELESRRLGGGKVVIFDGRRRVGALHIKAGHRGRISLPPGSYSL